jgi:hypothetical protein
VFEALQEARPEAELPGGAEERRGGAELADFPKDFTKCHQK